MNASTAVWVTSGLFGITYLFLAIGGVPGLRMDRAGIAVVGAALMLCTGAIALREATSGNSIDYPTLFLLFGMMVVVGFLRLSGFFSRLTHGALDRIQSPTGLLAMVILLAGLLSAFLVNDIVCMALAPLVLHLCRRLGYKPVPHLIALATAANIGSSATITGNPQNIFIGAHSHIAYLTFAMRLMPVAAIGLAIDFCVIAAMFRGELKSESRAVPSPAPFRAEDGPALLHGADAGPALRGRNRPAMLRLQYKSVAVAIAAVALFFTGLPIYLVAIGAAAVLMIGRVRPRRIYAQVDWGLLLMFVGLFIVVHAFQMHVVSRWDVGHWHILLSHPVDGLSAVSAVLSNLVSNVPAVLLFEPVMRAMPAAQQQPAWLALAMSSTLAGNLTVLGSVANLIVVEAARREGVEVSFWNYCKAGVPVTILTLAVGVGWLMWVRY